VCLQLTSLRAIRGSRARDGGRHGGVAPSRTVREGHFFLPLPRDHALPRIGAVSSEAPRVCIVSPRTAPSGPQATRDLQSTP
jgi:hypothetical protein